MRRADRGRWPSRRDRSDRLRQRAPVHHKCRPPVHRRRFRVSASYPPISLVSPSYPLPILPSTSTYPLGTLEPIPGGTHLFCPPRDPPLGPLGHASSPARGIGCAFSPSAVADPFDLAAMPPVAG